MKKTIAFDNETFLIAPLKPAPTVVCTTFCDGGDPWIKHAKHDNLEAYFLELLEDGDINFVGQNVAFDFYTLIATFPRLLVPIFEAYKNNRVTDISIRQQLWDISEGRIWADDKLQIYSLSSLVELIFDEKMSGKSQVKDEEDIWRLRYSELEDVQLKNWPQAALKYALDDSVWPWKIWNEQNEVQDAIKGEHEKAYHMFCLSLISLRGMRTDSATVDFFERRHTLVMQELAPVMKKAGLITIDKKGKITKKRKPAQERVVAACRELGVAVPLTPKGNDIQRAGGKPELKHVATDKVACLISQDALMMERVKYSLAEKMISTFLPIVRNGVTKPVTTRFNMAATGRTTSSSPRPPMVGGNFQNMPREGGLRECFHPRKGFVYLAADFSGAELHTLAQTCLDKIGYSVMGEKLKTEGEDVHSYMGSKLLGIPEAEMYDRMEAGDKEAKEARQDAKAANFGFPGGLKERGFMRDQLRQRERVWTFADAKFLRETWLAAFPEMARYESYCNSELGPAKDAVIAINKLGTLRRVNSKNQLANSYFQAPAASGALDALAEATCRCFCEPGSSLYGSRLVNFVHDENILEVPDDRRLHEKAMELKLLMETAFNHHVPDYPVSVEPVLMRYWSKKAEPTFDESGRLIPWEG